MTPLELRVTVVRLRAFLTLLLLGEIRIDGREAEVAVRRTRWHAFVQQSE